MPKSVKEAKDVAANEAQICIGMCMRLSRRRWLVKWQRCNVLLQQQQQQQAQQHHCIGVAIQNYSQRYKYATHTTQPVSFERQTVDLSWTYAACVMYVAAPNLQPTWQASTVSVKCTSSSHAVAPPTIVAFVADPF